MEALSTEIENLGYHTVEHEISNHFDLGIINSSDLPITLKEDESGTFYIDGTKKYSNFHIRIAKQTGNIGCMLQLII